MKTKKDNKISPLEFDKSQYVDSEMIDTVTLWMLRALIKAGGFKEFLSKEKYFNDEEIACFLDLEKYTKMKASKYSRNEVLSILQKKLNILEKKEDFSTLKTLDINLKRLGDFLGMSKLEQEILKFVVCIKNYKIFDTTMNYIGRDLTTTQVKKVLSIILERDYDQIDQALSNKSILISSSLLSIQRKHSWVAGDLDQKLDLLHNSFASFMMNSSEDIYDIIKESVKIVTDVTLKLKDYDYIQKDVELVLDHLKNSLKNEETGVNILLYGVAGTGKTEFVKTVANELGVKLFEVSYMDEESDAASSSERLNAYKSAQALLKNEKSILLYDEAEDIFDRNESLFSQKKQESKAWINRMLESNPIPTIWITNDIESVDSAIVRRFDITLELEVPKRKKRLEILKKYSNDTIDKKTLKKLSKNRFISPATMQRAIKVAQNIRTKDFSKTVFNLIDQTLKAQRYPRLERKKQMKENQNILPDIYDPTLINANTDLEKLANGISKNTNARLCLYGAPGTGKSAYGRYLAKKIGCDVIVKKGSDLLSKWLGVTEQNIANAFKEAKKRKALLIFDEVDSFLQDRTTAQASWEVSQVNEMLTQMENFEGVFIATTNLLDNLDRASLRRFDLKLEFGYLKAKQSKKLFESYVKQMNLSCKDNISLHVKELKNLTPGDFAAVARQNRFHPVIDVDDLWHRLKEEVKVKEVENNNVMGFIV